MAPRSLKRCGSKESIEIRWGIRTPGPVLGSLAKVFKYTLCSQCIHRGLSLLRPHFETASQDCSTTNQGYQRRTRINRSQALNQKSFKTASSTFMHMVRTHDKGAWHLYSGICILISRQNPPSRSLILTVHRSIPAALLLGVSPRCACGRFISAD